MKPRISGIAEDARGVEQSVRMDVANRLARNAEAALLAVDQLVRPDRPRLERRGDEEDGAQVHRPPPALALRHLQGHEVGRIGRRQRVRAGEDLHLRTAGSRVVPARRQPGLQQLLRGAISCHQFRK